MGAGDAAEGTAAPVKAKGKKKGTAVAKAEALEAKGVRVGRTPTQVAELAVSLLAIG